MEEKLSQMEVQWYWRGNDESSTYEKIVSGGEGIKWKKKSIKKKNKRESKE